MDSKTECGSFFLPVRVYLEDTDAGGVVFYANYLKFFERARTEFVRSLGFEMRQSLGAGVSFVVSDLNVQYKNSCFLDEYLRVYVELEKLKRSYFVVKQWVVKEGAPTSVVVEATVKVACVDLNSGKPIAMPATLHASLQ